jgi:hypothetical protein
MTHEEFLNHLLHANAGQRSPSLSSLTEEEAVARWLAFLTMCYVRMEHSPSGGTLPVPSITHVWRQWGRGGSEDIDMSLPTAGRVVQFKVQVQPADGYFFRLNDYDRHVWFDARGRAQRERGRLSIRLTQFPDTWAMVVRHGPTGRRQAESLAFRPASCCRRALAEIRQNIRSMQGIQAMLTVGQWVGLFEMVASPGVDDAPGVVESLSGVYDLQDSDWELWAQAMTSVPAIQQEAIRSVAGGEVINHQNDPARERFWTIIYESGAVR